MKTVNSLISSSDFRNGQVHSWNRSNNH